MKGLRNNSVRPRKRVIAILLSVLMVLSIIIPSGGSGVRYNAYAEGEESAIGEGVDLNSEEGAAEEEVTSEEMMEETSGETTELTAEETTELQKEEMTESIQESTEDEKKEIIDSKNDSATDATNSSTTKDEMISDEALANNDSEDADDDNDDEIIEEENLLGATQSSDLKEYVSNADAQTGVVYDSSNNSWTGVNLNNEYEFTIYFTEDQVKQFIETDAEMHYDIPAGIIANNISGTTINLIYKQGNSNDKIQVSNNPFRIENGIIYFNFNTSDPNFGTLKNSDDAQFYLTFKGKFDGSEKNINFGNGVTRTIDAVLDSDLSVDKSSTGSISADNDSINYSVRVSSKGYNKDVSLNDSIDNDNFKIDSITYTVYNSYGQSVSAGTSTVNADGKSFSQNLGDLPNGYYVDFNYKVKIKDGADLATADTDSDGKVGFNNTAKATTTSEDTDPSNNIKTKSNDVTYSSISNKSATVTDKEHGIVTWTITVNPERMVSLNGKSLSDVLVDSADTINDDQEFLGDVTVKGYANNSTGSGSADVEHTFTPSGKSFNYTFNETDSSKAYYYVITYQTQAQDIDKQIADMKLKNKATFLNVDKTAEATIGIDDEFDIKKTATEVNSDYVLWTVTVDVPAKGLDKLVLTDTYPSSNNEYFDSLDESSVSITGLKSTESIVKTYDTHGFTFTFKNSNGNDGLDGTGESRQIVITYKTNVDQDWLEKSKTDTWRKTHTNNITARANDLEKKTHADATPVQAEIVKSFVGKGVATIDGVNYPYYEFKVRVAPVDSDTITITDTLPKGFEIYTETPVTDWSKKTRVYGSNSVWNNDVDLKKTAEASAPDADNNVTFTVPIVKDSNTGKYYSYYWLDYYIIVKDKAAMKELDQAALDTDDDKLTLTNTATYMGESYPVNFIYEPNKTDSSNLTKELVSQENGVAKYKIDVNPDKLRLNNGEDITLTDTFTNLSIDYSTIKVTAVSPEDAEVVSCDVRSNVMTIVLNDEAHYIIEYESNILTNGEYKNVAEVKGFTATKSASYSSSGGGDYGNQLSINIFKQEYGNALNKLEGVEFQLFIDQDGVAVPVKDEGGNIVTATTDENGKATFQGSNSAGWKIVKGQKYYIKELNPPEGFLGIDGMYNFTVADVSDWNNFVYKTGETMRVDNDKIDLKVTKTLDNAPDDLDLSTIQFTVVVSEGEGDAAKTKTYTKTLAEIKAGVESNSKWYSYDSASNTYTWYFTNLTTGSEATVTETITATDDTNKPSSITYSIFNDGAASLSDRNYTSGTNLTVSGLGADSVKTVAFTNSYAGSVDVTPVAFKKLDNKIKGTGASQTYPLDGLSFGFSIYAMSDNLYQNNHIGPESVAHLTDGTNWNATPLSSTSASDLTLGKATFDKITYNLDGTTAFPLYYYYKIVENTSGYAEITDDTGYVIVSVVINKDTTSGELTKNVTYTKYKADGTVAVATTTDPRATAFNNSTADTTLSLKANKLLNENGRSITPENVFSFKLEPVTLNGITDDQTNANQADVTNSAGSVTFANLTYTAADLSDDSSNPTVYRYKISENDAPTGYTKDSNYYYVDVTLTRDTSTGGIKTSTQITKYNASGTVIEENVTASRVSFTNTKAARKGSISLAISKSVDGSVNGVTGNNYGNFDFYYGYIGEQSNTLKPDEISSSTAWSAPKQGIWSADANLITFPEINYSTENGANTQFGTGKHIYKIYEGANGYNGINNSRDYYVVVVSVTDPGSGTELTTAIDKVYKYEYDSENGTWGNAQSVSGTGTSNVIFDNTTNQVKLGLSATKKIAGGTYAKDGFKFKIEAVDNSSAANGKNYNATSGYTETVTTDVNGNAVFSDLVFSKAEDAGYYKFKVTEVAGDDASITYDSTEYFVTVKVAYNSTTKKLSAEIETVEKNDGSVILNKRIEFTNTLIPSAGSVALSAQKKLKKAGETETTTDITDSDGNLKEFSFKLEKTDSSGTVSGELQTKQNTINGSIKFDNIIYNSDDLTGSPYYYKISEVSPTSEDGYKYSTDVYFVKVELTQDTTNNRIVATPTYYKDSISSSNTVSAGDVVFVNEEREGVLKLKAKKVLVGASLSDYYGSDHNGFEFTATRDGKTYKGYNDNSGKVVIDINEVFGISDVIKTTTAVGHAPYEYVIKEISKDGFICDTNEYVAKVTFSFTSSGIEPTITYYKSTDLNNAITEDDVKFTNTKEDTQEITITALKTFGNPATEPGANRIFSFGLYEGDAATPVQIKQNDEHGNIAFDKIVYDQNDMGSSDTKTYVYKVKEIKPSPRPLPGYKYDTTEYTINVTLTRNNTTGKIDITHNIIKSGSSDSQSGTNIIGRDSSDNEFIQFNNVYEGKTDWPLSVRKVLSGNEDVNESFEFELYRCTGDDFDTNGITPIIVNSDNTGYAVFKPEDITINTGSTNYFVLKEVNTGDQLISYSTRVYKLIVTADPEGNVTVRDADDTNIIYDEARVTFTNSIEVKVKKTNADGTTELSGAELQVKNGDAVVNTKGRNDKTDGQTDNVYSGITVGQEYTLVENKAPVGYALADPVTFKVDYNSSSKKYELKVDYGSGYQTMSGSGDEAITVVMKDTSNSLIINKKISDTTYLAGATLQVKDVSGATLGTAWTTDTNGADNQNHSIDLSTLTPNKWYTLEETSAPFGYKIATPVQFMIDSDNKVWTKKQGEADTAKIELTAVEGKYTLTMFDEPLELTITKLNKATDDKLPGAVFSIYAKDGSGLIQSGMEVDSVGTLKLNVLSLGLVANKEYILEETTAPEGFEIINPITFKITNDNTLVVNGENQTGMEIKVYNKKEGTIYISKVDPSNPGVELRGALLVVSQDGTEKYSFTSTANAYEIRTGSLEKNKVYILKEIDAPKDANGVPTHYLAAEIKFYIDNDSELYVQKEGEADFSHSSDGKIVMEDKARDVVKISKVDLVTSDELPGAKLKITDENGRPVYEKVVDEHGSLITTTNKLEHTSDGTKWEIDYSTFELDTPYVLTEITAPDGYEVAEDITFKIVNEGGENVIKIKQTDGSWETNTNMTVVMQDAPMNNVSFVKLDKSSGQTLAGAGLTIYDSYGEIAHRFTTTKNATQFTVDEFNVNEEYTLKETTVPDGFYKADDVVFRVSFVNTQNGRVRKLFVKDTDGTFKVRETGQIVIEDERVYKVKISKVDLTSEEEVPGAHIQILDENGDVVTEWDSTDAPKEIEGLRPNVTYTLRETVAPEGYKITTDTTFALKADATIDYEKTSTAISSEGVLLVKDDITSINFTKYGLVNESCAPDPAAYIPLEGVEFEAYSIDEDGNVSDNPVATAKSSKNGIVVFNKLAKGKYQIRESKSVDAFKICEEYFYVTVDDNDFAGLTDEEGNKIDGNRIIDDQYRTDIVFTKVSERNKAKKLAGSTYGLYRKNDSAEETLVATSVSDKEGVVTFKGVLTNINYVVRELESPKGYYISENPMEMSFKLEGDKVVRNALSDGKGTVVLGANGEITWLEPSVIVSFLKVDGDNNPLPGATLAVLDMNGSPVKDADGKEIKWVSTNAAYEVADVFEDGVSYQLVELAAPEGYDVAEPIVFEIPEDKVGTGEEKVITVTMIDRAKTTTTVTPPEKTTPPSVKTGDSAPVKPVTAMMFISLAGIVFLLILGRRRKELFK